MWLLFDDGGDDKKRVDDLFSITVARNLALLFSKKIMNRSSERIEREIMWLLLPSQILIFLRNLTFNCITGRARGGLIFAPSPTPLGSERIGPARAPGTENKCWWDNLLHPVRGQNFWSRYWQRMRFVNECSGTLFPFFLPLIPNFFHFCHKWEILFGGGDKTRKLRSYFVF